MQRDSHLFMLADAELGVPEPSSHPARGLLISPALWLGGLCSVGFWVAFIRLWLN
jgi:hypothetical protein